MLLLVSVKKLRRWGLGTSDEPNYSYSRHLPKMWYSIITLIMRFTVMVNGNRPPARM